MSETITQETALHVRDRLHNVIGHLRFGDIIAAHTEVVALSKRMDAEYFGELVRGQKYEHVTKRSVIFISEHPYHSELMICMTLDGAFFCSHRSDLS